MTSETLELAIDQLKKITAGAMSLRERADRAAPPASPAAQGQADPRWQGWLAAAADGDPEIFERRLSFDELDRRTAKELLRSAVPPLQIEAAPWTGVLNEIIRKMPGLRLDLLEPQSDRKFPCLDQSSPVAFEELLTPFVEAAAERLHSPVSEKYPALPEKALAGLERSLLQMLSGISSRVLLVEFRTFLACRQLWGASRNTSPLPQNTGRNEYLGFIRETYKTGWGPIFLEYPVLARLLATALLQWVQATKEFLERLSEDIPELLVIFFGNRDVGNVAALKTDLSDPHNGNRTVILVEFDSGARVVYKPKNLGLDRRYFEFVDRLNGLGRTLPLRTLKILDRGAYGWMEYVGNTACRNEEELRRYYRRTGQFLCLVYAFNGIDFHFENMVACGEHPVPVDLETLFHHAAENPAADPELEDATARRLRDSVLRTHLLPNPVKFHGRYFDISGLSRSPEEEPELELLAWKNVNTDAMDYCYRKVTPGLADNLPKLEGKNPAPGDYVDEIQGGFREMYGLLRERGEKVLAEGGPVHRVFREEARFIFRATTVYLSVLKGATSPDSLRDGRDFAIRLEVLARRLLKSTRREKPALWPLLRAEQDDLWSLDVPRFTAPGDRNCLSLKSGEIVRDCFPESAWDRARKKIRSFGEEDLKWQLSLIRDSIAAANAGRLPAHASGKELEGDNVPDLLPGREELLSQALSVAREIEKAVPFPHEPEPSWLVLEYLPDADQFALRPIKYDLYSGRCGIALFLAALERALPGSGYRKMAYDTVGPVRRRLKRAEAKEAASMGLGGCAGLPSIAYSMARIGLFLEDAELLEEAKHACSLISRKQIDADTALDVIGGSAGTILALLACCGATGDGEILEKARVCGRRLVAAREADKSGFFAWPTLGGRHLTGFSHGAAGIAYALLKLYEQTSEREFYDAARDGINFERHEFSPQHNNWPDHREFKQKEREPAEPVYMTAWCHGAPGIGLARLGALEILDSLEIRDDIRSALLATRHAGLLPRDHLCCGNSGLAETLLTAGIRLKDRELTQEALRIMSRLTARANRRGTASITSGTGFFNPSLFQGAAGVGYQLLRVASPDIIPSVLLLE